MKNIPKRKPESFLTFFADHKNNDKVSQTSENLSVYSIKAQKKNEAQKHKKNQIFIIRKTSRKLQRLKNKLPFLRYFNPQFTKRENIDKKILREFKGFVSSKILKDGEYISSHIDRVINSTFWLKFLN